MQTPRIRRSKLVLNPDPSRVLIRPFVPPREQRSLRIISRVMALTEEEVRGLLAQVLDEFAERHYNITAIFLHHYGYVKHLMFTDKQLSKERKLLIGSYFTQEYSLEASALFNPSIVPHPNQNELAPGSMRFVLSLRATGEGHISSIVFRQGIIDDHGTITMTPPTPYVTQPERKQNPLYDKSMFERKLVELDLSNDFSARVMAGMGENFSFEELENTIRMTMRQMSQRNVQDNRIAENIRFLALSNYEVSFSQNGKLSERAIFPSSPSERNGLEDARFVHFQKEDGTFTYFAPYTAFDGKVIVPQLIETDDFLNFKIITLNGPAVQNKGMALFPRKINGFYAMLSRQDNENNFIMFSDNIHFWYTPRILVRPTFAWEFVQMGNCGSPIETDAGWLVLSHGVGPMRKYCIGAFLLDREDPSRVIGRMPMPLIKPNENEREGYVPNVVYTCGALVHNGLLIIPYAMSDYASRFATVPVKDVLAAME